MAAPQASSRLEMLQQEEALDQEMMERNRMMAKIHLMGFDETLKHRVRNDLESEEFPEYLMADVPDKLSKRNVTKKLSQAEERLERFKNANAKRGNMPKQSTSSNAMIRNKRSEQVIPAKSNSRLWSEIAGTSPTSARSGSSRASVRSQRSLENAKSPLPAGTRVVDEMRRRESSDTETLGRTSPRSFSTRATTKAEVTSGIYPRRNEFKSLTSDGKIFVRRSASPQYFCRESERSGTTMSIDRRSASPESPLFHQETLMKRSGSPRFFSSDSRKPSESEKSPIWGNGEISSRQSASPQYFRRGSERSDTAMSTDRETVLGSKAEWRKGISKSPLHEDNMLERRSTSPQFFCKESERSATTMSIDRATNESKSPSYEYREMVRKRNATPRFFFNESEQSRRTSESKSSTWDKGTSSRQSTSSRNLKKRSTSPQFFCKESERSATTMSIDRATSESKSPSYDREIVRKRNATPRFFFNESEQSRRTSESKSSTWDRGTSSRQSTSSRNLKKRSTSPQFFCKESERSATTMSIDRATSESKSPSYDREIVRKRNATPRFFFNESEQSRRTSESKSSTWSDKRISPSTSPQYFRKSKQSDAAMSADRKIVGFKLSEWSKGMLTKRDDTTDDFKRKKVQTNTNLLGRLFSPSTSPLYKEKILKRRSTSPQFFCKESERSATTMNIDRKSDSSGSPLFHRETLTKHSKNRPFFLNQSRRMSESKSPVSDGRGISSKPSTSPQYLRRESKRSDTAMSTDRETIGSKSSEWSKRSASPRFFCRESERSGTTMNIDRKVGEPRSSSYDRKISTKRSATPRMLKGRTEQRSSITSIDRKYGGFKSPGITRDKRTTSPQFFCKESERSATTMLIEPRPRSTDSTKSILKQRSYDSDTSYRRPVKSPIDKKVSSTKGRHTPSPSVTGHEVKDASKKREVPGNVTEARRSSRISETSSASSLVNLKYGLEFDNIFQSSGLVRKFMKSQNGKQQRATRHSPSKRNVKNRNARISPRGNNQSKGRRGTSSHVQTARSPSSIEGCRRRATPEFSRKSITPTEVDMDIQEITMTDHRIERDKLQQKAPSPISKRQFDGAYAQSSISVGAKFKTSTVRGTHGQREPVLETSVFQSKEGEARRRASSRSSNRSAASAADSPRAKSPDFSRVKKYPGTVPPILYDFAERTKGARTKLDRSQTSRSADDEYNRGRGGGGEGESVAVDEVDAGIGVRYHQTVAKTALNKENKGHCEVIRPKSSDRIASRRVFPRETTRKPTKSSTSKKIISPTRDCGRRHDVKSRVSPRVSPLRKTAEIARSSACTPKIFSSRSIESRADQSAASKFSSRTVEDRRSESVLVAKKLAKSLDEMSVKRNTEEPGNIVRELSLVRREGEKDLARMDSVESALKRFDSIGAEFERASPTSLRESSEISLQTMDIQKEAPTKESIASEGTTVPSREATGRTILRTTLKSPVGKDVKAGNAACKSDLGILQKETRFSKRGGDACTESERGPAKIRSPTCKRRLFESDSESREGRPKSSRAKVRKGENCSIVNLRLRKDEAVSNRDDTRKSTTPEEMITFSVKPLRSIEDIRKLIDNERSKLVATKESRSAIANRRAASRERADAKRSSPVTDAARNVLLGADPARLTYKIESCVSRITKSPSPDSAATKQRETNARTTRGSAPSSPSKSPDVAPRRTATESRNQEAKPSRRSTKGADSTGSRTVTGAIDTADGFVLQNDSPNESTRKSDAFVVDYDDRPSKEDDAMPSKKSSMRKPFNDKQQTASSASGRPTSSSNSSVNLIQDSSAKSKMAESERGKGIGKGVGKSRGKNTEKPSSGTSKLANASSFNEDATNDTKGLTKCKTCGRSFAQNRIDLHEQICMKTTTKKRKQFDPVMCRVKGTELEPFVRKSFTNNKRETKTKKPEIKPDWRRKHEEFINAIRYARDTQARLAAGENLNDLPPPPPSDTSDYVPCEHCGRKFSRSAAERHIPICKRMHDKKQTPAPRARR
ncbi:PREDICTED: uncharacterized protein LOC105451238 isoform X2 [Wasmannia auropunctata]|uniref:uncharacterized protein LOC105451238 isoform X2 n=1 Tax=Wasmannia auropunctata TaxID=64793 RepID=UPI0005ED8F10|nr:PREDICTED: uncharacterized protein LOC105451238 isoform X2 [Wasmannia auropunctata]